jgi:2-polyprenyl-3-methyl-5-hydroxy-6-metoxy-1,4-benzoquinol methylase
LFGFDSDRAALEHARAAGYDIAIGDLLHAELPAAPGPADVLVCADVLEHVPDPGSLLARLLATYLRPGGTLIVSLPNVAHWYVRASLLLGRWEYADKGILDRTHLRFFSARAAERLLLDTGLRILRRHSTPLPLPVVSAAFAPGRPLHPLHALSARLTRLRPTLLAYQFVFVGEYPRG